MHIKKVEIKNFRLLKQVDLLLEEKTTLIVGRNNSGKTSLAELFRRLLSENSPSFSLEDFSLGAHKDFWTAFALMQEDGEEADVQGALPVIEAKLTINYDKNAADLGPLSDFIIDINMDCTEALIVIRYQLEDGKVGSFFEGITVDPAVSEIEQRAVYFQTIKELVPKHFKARLLAVDPNDYANEKSMDWAKMKALLQSGFIYAQRGLDDITHKETDILGKILEVLFNTATSESADPRDRSIAQELEAAVQTMQGGIDRSFNGQLTGLLPAFELFGYPGLPDPRLRTETILDVERLLKNHTKIRYTGINGVHLPEAYNGLGVRNLIFILLKLLEYFKSFKVRQPAPGVHIIFIEEPEAHLHPQMQEVFISKLSDIANVFAETYSDGQPWPVQFVVTTHSSHMANKAPFESMRYFLAIPENEALNIYAAKIKDLKMGLCDIPTDDKKFLHQYMTLTRCDLLFADKAILIEGTTERLLLPKMIDKTDEGLPDGQKIASQYVSIMEVGGAYAHKFFDLLNFLELPSLIITDIDTVNQNDSGKACMVSDGTRTSNACIKAWFQGEDQEPVEPSALIQKPDEEKTCGVRRLAYQVPELDSQSCGRSFEDAFILANSSLFELAGDTDKKNEEEAWAKAKNIKKSEFALKYAIENPEWIVPRYIKEGLLWLAQTPKYPPLTPSSAAAEADIVIEVALGQDATHA